MLAMLHWRGVEPSYSRPRVSHDNAHAEARFHTAQYRPEFPARGFENLDDARRWATDFVRWDNTEHLPSGIRTVTPEQRHSGEAPPFWRLAISSTAPLARPTRRVGAAMPATGHPHLR